MSLDLGQVAAQIARLAARLRSEGREQEQRLELAVKLLREADAAALRPKIDASSERTSWPVAVPLDQLDACYQPAACPSDFTVIATDGSHIDVDRHSSVRCYLINIGRVLLHYGGDPSADLVSEAALFFGDDLVLTDPVTGRQELIEGTLLGVKRSVAECRALAYMASDMPGGQPSLALIDGSLVLWGLSPRDYESHIREELLDRQYLGALDVMQRISEEGSFAVAGYTSFPRSAEVVNLLRLLLCPHDVADCERNCSGKLQRECDAIAGVKDSDLFDVVLEPGERSGTFSSGSKFVKNYYGGHQVYLFYLKTDEEVARVEIPQWIAEKDDLVGMVHTLILDQCRRGHGYPVALMEAHEQAVVTAADRDAFWGMVEQALAEEKVELRSSGKIRSKRGRWV